MRKIIITVALSYLVVLTTLFVVRRHYTLTKDNELTIVGFSTVISTVILLFFQIRIGLLYNKRKAAMDFCYNQIQKKLFPLIIQLKAYLNKDFLVFLKEEKVLEWLHNNPASSKLVKGILLDILNFYERMAIGILKEVFDEDICYDDNGFNLLEFYKFINPFIVALRVKHNEERLFINFTHVAERWKKRYEKAKRLQAKFSSRARKKNIIKDPSI